MSVAIYARVSTALQAEEGFSIDEQVIRMKSFCQAKDWGIFKVYTDPGFSGTSMERPGLQLMLSDIKTGNIKTVLVYKLDRLSRSQKDALYLIEDVFLKNDVDFVSMSENFDTSTPLGRAMIGILAVFAQLEREQIRERMTLGKEARAKQGLWHGGANPPIGYIYNTNTKQLEVDEHDAEIIRRIFDLYINGTPLSTIEQTFIAEGVKSRYGQVFKPQLRLTLLNPVYAGYITDKGVKYPGLHEPLVSKETFEKAQNLLNQSKEAWDLNIRSAKNPSLLTGLVFCAHCGGRYHVRQWKSGRRVYTCYSRDKSIRNMIKDPNCKNKIWERDELDNHVLDQIRTLSIDPLDPPPEAPVKPLTKQLDRLRRQRAKYMDLYALDEMSVEAVTEKIEPLNKTILALERQIENAHQENRMSAEFVERLNTVSQLMDIATPGELRQMVLSLINKIVLDGNSIEIHWKI